MFASPSRYLSTFIVRLIQVLRRAVIWINIRLENALWFFSIVFSTERMCQLHLCVCKHLLFEVTDLPLMTCRTFDWVKSAVVLIARANRHVIETAVYDAGHAMFQSCSRCRIDLGRARVGLALINNAMVCGLMSIMNCTLLVTGR